MSSEPLALLLDAVGAADLLDVSRSHFLRLHASGQVPQPVRLGRRVLWIRSELEAWLKAGAPSRERWSLVRGN